MQPFPALTIGIPVYNGRKDIEACVKSIRDELTGLAYETIIVDDGKSTELCGDIVKKYLPAVKYIHDPDCFGIAQATGKIIAAMRGRYLLRLDADTIINREAVENMTSFMDSRPQVGVLAPKLVNTGGSFQPSYETHFKEPVEWFWDYALWIKKLYSKLRKPPIHGEPFGRASRSRPVESRFPKSGTEPSYSTEPFEVAYMASAAVMIRKTAIDQVGSIDPEMEFFMEDADWIIRIGQNWNVLYWPTVSIIHIGGQSGQLYIHCRDRSLKNLYYFYRKHRPGLVNQIILTIVVLSGSLVSLMLATLFLPTSFLKPRWRIVDQRALNSFFNVFRWHAIKLVKS